MNGNDYSWLSGFSLVALVAAVALIVGIAISLGNEKLVYVAALIAIPLALKYPVEVALGSIALVFPFDSILVAVKSGSGTTTVTWFVSVAAGGLLAARIISGVRDSAPAATRLWILLIVWGSITTLWAVDENVSLKRLPMAWSLLILYLVAAHTRVTKKQLNMIITLTVIGGLAAALWASWAFISGSSWANTGRASLSLDTSEADPNYFAAMLMVPLALAVGMFRNTRALLLKSLMALTIFFASVAIFLTMSRGALVAMILMAGVFVYRLGIKARTVAVIVVVLLALTPFAPPALWKRLQPEALATGTGRTNIWAAGSQMIKHHFILGVGLSNFPVAYDAYAGAGPKFQGYQRDSHNTYLNILAEQGAIGLALFLVAVFYQFRMLRGALGKARAPAVLVVSCEAALVAVLGAGFFLDLLFSKFIWFLLILCALVARAQKEQAASSQTPAKPKLSTVETVLSDPIFTR